MVGVDVKAFIQIKKNVFMQHTLGMHFSAISTIAIIIDPNTEYCNEAWSTHH